jgi:hypothetical protein
MGSGVSTMAKTKAKTLHPMMDRKLQASIAHHEGFASVHRDVTILQEAATALERTEMQLADKSKVLAMQTTELRNVQVRFASLWIRSLLGSRILYVRTGDSRLAVQTQLKETQQLLEREKIIQDKLKLRQTDTLRSLRSVPSSSPLLRSHRHSRT